MKRLNQISKVIILALCMMFMLFNVSQGGGPHCEEDPVPMCQQLADHDCDDLCDLAESFCDEAVFYYGQCTHDGFCYQTYEIYCESGYLDEKEYECWGTTQCPLPLK